MTNAKQANNRFMVKSSSRLLTELLTRGIAHAADSQETFIQLARQLASIAETAYNRRDFHALKEAGELLIALPVARAQSAGLWYQAILHKRDGRNSEAIHILERLTEDLQAAPRFRARALQTLGNVSYESRDLKTARQLYRESAHYISRESPQDAYILAYSIILHSITRADEGDSRQALNELSSIKGLVDTLRHPYLKAIYFNNIAVDLMNLGRIGDAAPYSHASCSSPVAFAYPEFRETALEIEQRTAMREAVAVAARPEPRKRPAQPKYLLIVLRYSPPARVIRPALFRQRVACSNPTVTLVASVARVRAPSFYHPGRSPNLPSSK